MLWLGLLLIAVPLVTGQTPPLAAQGVVDRTPNLSGGWVGEPGTIHLNLVHRFWLAGSGDNRNLVNTPTMLVGVPLPGRLLTGLHYASNSLISSQFNEWEVFGRWAPLEPGTLPVELAFTGAYNSAAGSGDGEVSATLPAGPLQLVASGRAFSDALGSGDAGWAAAGGAVWQVRDGVSLAGDYGAMWVDGTRDRPAWGAGVQLRIPTTPHSLSIQAANTRTGTLQGASVGGRTVWGFEFTAPITLARYFPGMRASPGSPESPVRVGDEGDTVEVTMADLAFLPAALEIQAGETVVWRNTSPLVHTVTADPDRAQDPDRVVLPNGVVAFDSGDILPGGTFQHTFTVPGEYAYICVPHEAAGMFGRITVLP